ncbi:MAG: HDOD domain-containing protein [bacterium]
MIDSTCELPPMPVVVSRVISLASDPDTDAKVMERAILADHALTTGILKIANSSFYGCQRTTNTLASAIVLIGFNGIKALAVAASLKSLYREIDLTEKMLWEHSVGAAIAAHILSRRLGCNIEEAFVGGFIHDIGKVILNNQMNNVFREIMQASYNEGISFVDAERERLGITHAEIGGLIMKRWNLSAEMVGAVTYHHHVEGIDPSAIKSLKFAALLNLADHICGYLGIGYREAVKGIDFNSLKSFQILKAGEARFPAVIEEIRNEYEAEKGNF